MACNILQLSELISTSIASLVDLCSKNNLQVPDLNDTKLSPESEAFRANPDAAKAANIIAAAAFQLAACVLPPYESLIQTVSGHMKSAALRVSIESHVAEILHDVGPEGMHVNKIAAKTGIDGAKLARILRLLANRHIFREVQPDFFINNRISGMLDTGKTIDEILCDPGKKYDGTSGFVALLEHMVSTGPKGSVYVMENMKDPVTAFSEEPNHAPFQRAIGTDEAYFDWYTQPEQAYHRHRFGIGMKGTTVMIRPDLLLDLFDWAGLPKGAVVIDVGGGIGSSGRAVSKAHPHLQVVVQDLPKIVEDGAKYWEKEDPDALASGRLKFQGTVHKHLVAYRQIFSIAQAHDFFAPQPVKDASVFLVKHILHDWSDTYNMKLLTSLRNSAKPDTILLVLDAVIPYSCREVERATEDYVVVEDPIVVAPDLLATGFNSVNDLVWTIDGLMLTIFNTQERTITQFKQLFLKCGWRITKFVRTGSSIDGMEAVPI